MSAALAPVLELDAKQSLYAIVDYLGCLFESLDALEDPELKAQCEAEIDLYLMAEVKKVDRICAYIAHREAQRRAADVEIARLQMRKKACERDLERIDESVKRVMAMWGLTKLEGRSNTLILKKCPPSVEVLDIAAVPDRYKRVTVTESVDKMSAKVELAAGRSVPGLTLITDRQSVVRR